jgi:multidrug transporter EmrE-like cation transporter
MASELVLKLTFFVLLILSVTLEIIGDIFLKKWSSENKTLLLFLGLGIYFVGTIFWALSLKYEFLSKAVSLFTVINLVAILLVGVFLFKEEVSFINKIGLFLGLISVILIEM